MALSDFTLNRDRYVALLTKLIGESEYLQDNPPKFVPQEDRAIKHLLELLSPHSLENGGPLKVDHITFVKGRGNLMLEYRPEGASGTVAFVGSHLDVVPANPENWDRNPFVLTQEGDKLYGRGTTDCLGHVALITDLFLQLAEKKPKLKFAVIAIFIAAEESNVVPGVGVDKLMETGRLDHLKEGPIYWVDSADTHPCMGTASGAMWTLRVEGRLFHSGLPHKGINSVELAMEAVKLIQEKFYRDYPPHEQEERYKFSVTSTMKPTQIRCAEGSINQIPPWTEVQGDVRLTPFYSIDQCMENIKGYVLELNDNLSLLPTRGPCSKYEISIDEGDFKGKISIQFEGEPFKGIAVNLDSAAFKHLNDSTAEVVGESKPYSLTGCLPLVGDLKDNGYDVQVCGYGESSVYHGDNEYCSLNAMDNGFKIIRGLLQRYNQ